MDRTFRGSWLLALAVAVGFGPGCARLQKYRAQNSPLPILKKRRSAPPALAKRAETTPPPAQIAWSGEPNTSAPATALAPRRDPAVSPSAPAASPRVAAPKPPAEGAIATIKPLLAQARKTLGSMKNYRVTMDRQERVNGALGDAERIVLSIRRDPKGVLLQWPDGPQKGREVLYSTPEGEGKIHLNMADTPLVPRMALDPLSPMVMKYSRHPITEAGLEDVLGQMEAEVRKIESGQPGGDRLSYGGLETPAGLNSPGHKIIRQSPRGQTWIVYLDPANGLPMSVRETGPGGELVEQYTFRDFQSDLPELASSTAFDPNARWGAPKGLFGRLAQTPGSANPARR